MQIRRSYLNGSDGSTTYRQLCKFDAAAGKPDQPCIDANQWVTETISSMNVPIAPPNTTASSYTTYLFPQSGVTKLRQTFLDTNGTAGFYRTCDFNKATNGTSNCTGWSSQPNKAIAGSTKFKSYTVIVYPLNNPTKIRRSYLNGSDGSTTYYQICKFDAAAGKPDQPCIDANQWVTEKISAMNNPIAPPNTTASSYTTYLFPQGSVTKLRQTFLDTNGTAGFYRTCDFDNNTGGTSNCIGWSSQPNKAIAGSTKFKSYTVIVF
jgi:hypothetical protein